MNVRAKFKVQTVTDSEAQPDAAMRTVELVPVYGPGNESWSRWTPSGQIKITITNPEAAKQFKPGQLVYVDFKDVEHGDPVQLGQ